jgi:hypothetical protein
MYRPDGTQNREMFFNGGLKSAATKLAESMALIKCIKVAANQIAHTPSVFIRWSLFKTE